MAPFDFASEVVTEGHLDKLCDRICDALRDEILQQDEHATMQLEACAKLGMVMLLGEVASKATVSYEQVIRETVKAVGYDNEDKGLDWRTMNVIVALEDRTPDLISNSKDQQAVLVGYASDETPELMPLTQQLASALATQMDQLRKDGTLPWLHPDAELQVTVHYDVDGESQAMIPQGVTSVSIVYGHLPELRPVDPEKELLEKVVKVVIPSQWLSASTDYLFTLRERKSSSRVAGVSGRRAVEIYGGWVACGTSAVGRDIMNLSHCGQLAACWAAKSLVASKLCRRCAVQLRYLPRGATLVPSVQVELYGARTVESAKNLEQLLLQHFDFRPSSLRELGQLGMREPFWEKPKVLQ